MNILHIDSSPRGEQSYTRKMTAEVVAALKENNEDATVVYRDLGRNPPPFVTEEWASGAYTTEEDRTPAQVDALRYSDEAIAELLAADTVVIGTPMYNFGLPADLKAWIDQIIRINKTFKADYTGLAGDRKAIVVLSRGGSGYDAGEPMEKMNFQDPYFKAAFGFIGIKDLEFIHVNNTSKGEDAARESTENARKEIEKAVAATK